MALSNVALFGAAFLTPVFAGKITHSLGWQWTFYLVAIFAGAALPFIFFLVPETAFSRPDYLNTDFESGTDRTQLPHHGSSSSRADSQLPLSESGSKSPSAASNEKAPKEETWQGTPPKRSYWETLRLFNGRKTDEDFFKLLLRPFPLFLHPGILWVSFI